MKKIITAFTLSLLLFACSNVDNSKNSNKEADKNTTEDISTNPDYQKGLALVTQNDCLSCHKVSETLVGPSFSAIAAKYVNDKENIDQLASKVIHGGTGVWGNVPMTPHSTLSQSDAEQMVKYILLLEKH